MSSPFNTRLLDNVSALLKQEAQSSKEKSLTITSKKQEHYPSLALELEQEKTLLQGLEQWLEQSLSTARQIEGEQLKAIPQEELSPRARLFLSEVENIVKKKPENSSISLVKESAISLPDGEDPLWLSQAFKHIQETRRKKYQRMLS